MAEMPLPVYDPGSSPTPKPPVQSWDPSSVPGTSTGGPQASPGTTPPTVPSYDGSGGGGVRVSTAALTTFGNNMGALADAAGQAITQLSQMPTVRPGQFYLASQLSTGSSGVSKLSEGLHGVLTTLKNTLLDTQTAMAAVASKYTSSEDANNINASDLNTALTTVTTDIGGLGSAAKGLPSGTIGG
jgi:hypothetical protein